MLQSNKFCAFSYIISPDDLVCDSKPPHGAKCSYKWSLEEVGSRARSERVSKFYGRFAEEAERLGISHACFASYLGYRYVTFKSSNAKLFYSLCRRTFIYIHSMLHFI